MPVIESEDHIIKDLASAGWSNKDVHAILYVTRPTDP